MPYSNIPQAMQHAAEVASPFVNSDVGGTVILKAIDIIGMLTTAAVAFISTTFAFVVGLISVIVPKIKFGLSVDEYDSKFFWRITVIPIFYMFAGGFLYTIFQVFVDWWFTANITQHLHELFSFSSANFTFANNINADTMKQVLASVRNVMLYFTAFTFVSIPVIYASMAIPLLNASKVKLTPFANIFHFSMIMFVAFFVMNLYDTLITNIFFKNGVTIENVGHVSNLFDYVRGLMRQAVHLSISNNLI